MAMLLTWEASKKALIGYGELGYEVEDNIFNWQNKYGLGDKAHIRVGFSGLLGDPVPSPFMFRTGLIELPEGIYEMDYSGVLLPRLDVFPIGMNSLSTGALSITMPGKYALALSACIEEGSTDMLPKLKDTDYYAATLKAVHDALHDDTVYPFKSVGTASLSCNLDLSVQELVRMAFVHWLHMEEGNGTSAYTADSSEKYFTESYLRMQDVVNKVDASYAKVFGTKKGKKASKSTK